MLTLVGSVCTHKFCCQTVLVVYAHAYCVKVWREAQWYAQCELASPSPLWPTSGGLTSTR